MKMLNKDKKGKEVEVEGAEGRPTISFTCLLIRTQSWIPPPFPLQY